jgi:hypothetical protein
MLLAPAAGRTTLMLQTIQDDPKIDPTYLHDGLAHSIMRKYLCKQI